MKIEPMDFRTFLRSLREKDLAQAQIELHDVDDDYQDSQEIAFTVYPVNSWDRLDVSERTFRVTPENRVIEVVDEFDEIERSLEHSAKICRILLVSLCGIMVSTVLAAMSCSHVNQSAQSTLNPGESRR